jgi:putative endopeptidase
MNKMLFGALCAAAFTACSKQPAAVGESGIDYANLDSTARPGDDFFQYATGHWIDHNPQPAAFPRWGSFTKLADDNTNQLNELITSIAAQQNEPGSIAQKIGDLYNLCMDSTRLNAEGYAPLKPYLDKIAAIQTREELIQRTADQHDDLLFDIYVSSDEKNSAMNIVCISQGGLSLGDKEYYLSKDENTVAIREAFKEHVVNLYKLCGYDDAAAKAKMETIMRLETSIAEVSIDKEDLRDPEANYHKMTLDELSQLTNNFNWADYFKAYTYDSTTEVDLGQIVPVAKACELLQTAPLEDLKTIYEWQTISWASGMLSDAFTDENFAFNQKLTGAREQQPRWKRAIGKVNTLMGQPVGQLYVEKYFPAEYKERMLHLVHNLQTVLGQRIQAQEWMSDSTKAVALEKLNAFYVKIGYPDKWDDISGLTIDPQLSLLDNVYNASLFYWNLNKEKRYNKPVDRDEWHMTPQTVNAYYNPTTNEICFPAGILQPPFFNMEADDACNYGAIGVVIGHEMTHGFDDQGRQYDKDGNLNIWWAEEDIERFKVPANALADYFDQLEVLPGLRSNGRLCLGENLADHGGINIAFQALQLAMKERPLGTDNGFTPEQRFFLSYANVWAGVSSDEILRYLTMMDVHSANFLRVNGTLPHIDAWYEAFNIQPGDKLYLPKEQRVNIW